MEPDMPTNLVVGNRTDHCRTILVIDDNDAVRAMLDMALRKKGFIVYTACSGAQACVTFTKFHDRISVVLLDVDMPELDGPKTLEALQAIAPVQCFFMTAGNHTTAAQLHKLGAVGVFDKPFRNFDAVIQTLYDACQGGPTARHAAHSDPTGEAHFDKQPSKSPIDG
jgi:CheY-like chemotaxis protein